MRSATVEMRGVVVLPETVADRELDEMHRIGVRGIRANLIRGGRSDLERAVRLAGRIARASGRLGRDWPDLPALTFPPLFPLAVALALAASFAPGAVGIAGASFSGALLLAYLISGLALMHYDVRVVAPVLAGDTIRLEIEVADKRETKKPDRGIVTFRHRVVNQRGEPVMEATVTRMIKRGPP